MTISLFFCHMTAVVVIFRNKARNISFLFLCRCYIHFLRFKNKQTSNHIWPLYATVVLVFIILSYLTISFLFVCVCVCGTQNNSYPWDIFCCNQSFLYSTRFLSFYVFFNIFNILECSLRNTILKCVTFVSFHVMTRDRHKSIKCLYLIAILYEFKFKWGNDASTEDDTILRWFLLLKMKNFHWKFSSFSYFDRNSE